MRNPLLLIFRILCSVKLAVLVIIGLAGSLIAATFLESLYDTPTAQYHVYRSMWFFGILFLLGLQIICVALSRLPWKKHHIPFLLAHLGITLLLFGSWITYRYGLDGSLRLTESETGSVVESPELLLHISEGTRIKTVVVPWTPPEEKFTPIEVSEYGLTLDQFMTHADPQYSFVELANSSEDGRRIGYPAIQLVMSGGPMRINQEFWLWTGDRSFSAQRAGPALLILNPISKQAPTGPKPAADRPGPSLVITPLENGDLHYQAVNSAGELRTAVLKAGKIAGSAIDPGWKGGVKIKLAQWIPSATYQVDYKPSQIQYGDRAPYSALHVKLKGADGNGEKWLGVGDRAILHSQGKEIQLSYLPRRVVLPFGIRLERFTLDRYEGTRDPSSYASRVTVIDSDRSRNDIVVSMNEPLKHGGITFYQSSYEDAEPRPVVSILSVNRDPGRWLKYFGSLLIVVGSSMLFQSKYKKRKAAAFSMGSAAFTTADSPKEVRSS